MNQLTSQPIVSPRGAPAFRASSHGRTHASCSRELDRDELFLQMLNAYRISGGLFRGADVNTLLEGHGRHCAGTVDHWIENNEVIHFEWQCLTWMPRFQFDMAAKAPWTAVGLVATELAGVFDNWQMALWFAHPSTVLEGRLPADALRSDPDQVIQAARHDRQRAA